MSLVPSLLQAIITTDGEALVLHVGEKPYVVTPTDQVDLATRGLTLDAVNGIVSQLLPVESQQALDEFGAVQYELPALAEFPGEHFTVVAARGGDDLWAEIRRRSVPDEDRVPAELFESREQPAEPSEEEAVAVPDDFDMPKVSELWADQSRPEPQAALPPRPVPSPPPASNVAEPVSGPASARPPQPPASREPVAAPPREPVPSTVRLQPAPPYAGTPTPRLSQAPPPAEPARMATTIEPPAAREPPPTPRQTTPPPAPQPILTPQAVLPPAQQAAPQPIPPPLPHTAPQAVPPPAQHATPQPVPPPAQHAAPPRPAMAMPPPQPAVVLPLSRNPIRPDVPAPLVADALAGLDRLLRLAAARGASSLYLSSAARPSLRVDGDVQAIDGAPVLGPNDVEALLLALMPERNAEALRTGVASEWICDLPDVGRVRCLSFRDHRGPGGVFRLMPLRTITAEQLGLTREIQAMAIEPEGLILVAGPRSSGKRTLMSALVDLINRTRRDHVITIEREINMVHERMGSFVSQREVRGGTDEMLAVARAALREDPDILVLEEVRTAGLMNLALDAAASGQLVIGGFAAHNAAGALDRIIDLYPPEYRRPVQLSLAQNLRGVVAQVLLRRVNGGRVAAREVLLNTPAVRSLLAEGKTSQLPLAIEGGRPYGMMPLNDALVGFVQSGTVDVREAYWRAADRAGFLALLKRQGLDTSLIERPA